MNQFDGLYINYFVDKRNINVSMNFQLTYDEGYFREHPYLQVRINPWEHKEESLPAQDLSVNVLSGWCYGDASTNNDCNDDFNYSISYQESQDYFIFEHLPILVETKDIIINLTGLDQDSSGVISFFVNYTLPNAIKEQGDFYFAHLTYENLNFKEVNGRFYFPDENAIPKFIPEDLYDIRRMPIIRNGKVYYRWEYVFKGEKDRIFFYQDYNKLKEEDEELQSRYTWRGGWIGFFFSLLASLIILGITLTITRNKKKKSIISKKAYAEKATLVSPPLPMGETYFNLLKELCNTPNSTPHNEKTILNKLNKGKTTNMPYYGVGREEFDMLKNEGYIHYYLPNEEERKLPKSEQCIQATPKAFELVEGRESKIIAEKNGGIALYIGLMSALVGFSTLFYIFFSNIIISFFSAAIIMIVMGAVIYIGTRKIRTK